MKRLSNLALLLASTAVCLLLAGCFSFTKEEVTRSSVPAVEVPPMTSSTTTTTTSNNGLVERQRTTTYAYP